MAGTPFFCSPCRYGRLVWRRATTGELRAVSAAERERLLSAFADLGREGFRVLGIAWRHVLPDHRHAIVSDETALTFYARLARTGG